MFETQIDRLKATYATAVSVVMVQNKKVKILFTNVFSLITFYAPAPYNRTLIIAARAISVCHTSRPVA